MSVESAPDKLRKLAKDLAQARRDTEILPHKGDFLGVGATVRVPEGSTTRHISAYARNLPSNDGIEINFFEKGSNIPEAYTTYQVVDDGILFGQPDRSTGTTTDELPSVAMLGRSREFGRRSLYFLTKYKPGEIIPTNGETFKELRDAQYTIKYIDDVFRHAISQAATYQLMDDDSARVAIQPQKETRLPIQSYNKCAPGHGHSANFFAQNVDTYQPGHNWKTPDGLSYNLYSSDGGEYEGTAFITVIDSLQNLTNPELYPKGPYVRMHSACSYSRLGKAPEGFYAARLEELHANFKNFANSPAGVSEAAWHVQPPWGYKKEPTTCCDCDVQITAFFDLIKTKGGMLAEFVEQEGRGYGLLNKDEFHYRLYEEEGEEYNTGNISDKYGINSDIRVYETFARELRRTGIKEVRLVSNNPRKIKALRIAGIQVNPVGICIPTPGNRDYLRIKRDKLGHASIPNDQELDKLIDTGGYVLIE